MMAGRSPFRVDNGTGRSGRAGADLFASTPVRARAAVQRAGRTRRAGCGNGASRTREANGRTSEAGRARRAGSSERAGVTRRTLLALIARRTRGSGEGVGPQRPGRPRTRRPGPARGTRRAGRTNGRASMAGGTDDVLVVDQVDDRLEDDRG